MVDDLIFRYSGRGPEFVIYRHKTRQAVFISYGELMRLGEILRTAKTVPEIATTPFSMRIKSNGSENAPEEFHRRVFYSKGKAHPYVGDQLELGLYDCRLPNQRSRFADDK